MKHIDINLLFPHEEIDKKNLKVIHELVKKNNNSIFKPIIVDKNTYTVLDGHHRLYIAYSEWIQEVPVLFVNYFSRDIILESKTWLTKIDVVYHANKNKLFPPKTTIHYIIKNWEKVHISNI